MHNDVYVIAHRHPSAPANEMNLSLMPDATNIADAIYRAQREVYWDPFLGTYTVLIDPQDIIVTVHPDHHPLAFLRA